MKQSHLLTALACFLAVVVGILVGRPTDALAEEPVCSNSECTLNPYICFFKPGKQCYLDSGPGGFNCVTVDCIWQ